MGKGKKKGKKQAEGDEPSVAGLSLEDAPSTSQAPEEGEGEEEQGLTAASRRKLKKQKLAEAKAASVSVGEESTSVAQPEPKPEPKLEEKKDEPKPEVKKDEPKAEETEGLGLGLSGPKKKPNRKKKSLAAAEATATHAPPAAPPQVQPVPQYSAAAPPPAQTGAFQMRPAPGPWMAYQGPTAARPTSQDVRRDSTWQGPPAQQLPQGPPAQQLPQGTPAQQLPRGPPAQQLPQGTPAQQLPRGPPAQQLPQGTPAQQLPRGPPAQQLPQGPPRAIASATVQPTGTRPKEVAPLPSSRLEQSCRFRIPLKVIGNNVRHHPTRVITNYLPMTFKPIKVYRYDVTVKPDKPKKMLPTVFKVTKQKYFPNDFIAFDQSKNCYSLQPLKDVPTSGSSRHSVQVEIKDSNDRLMMFDLSFKATGVVDFGRIKTHMEQGGSSLNTPSEEIQCIDVILRQGALEAYVKCGRQFFKRPNNPINLSGGLEMWTGLFQSAIFTSKAFINIDVAHKGFPIQQSMIDAITRSFRLETDRRIEDQRSREVEYFLSFVRNLRVVATLVGPPNNGQTREFTCNGLADPPSKLSFECERDGKRVTMTVADYFAREKGYRIKYPYLNCMWVGPREKFIYYPMELLEISYGQARNRQLNELQLANMVKEAATPPIDRKRKIEEVAACMNYSSNTFFKKFGLEISNKFFEVEAKILTPPNLDCGDRGFITPRRGVWQTNRLVKPEALASWGFIAIDLNPMQSNYETIKDLLMNSGRQMGMSVAEPKFKFFNVRITELRNVLFTALEKEVRFLFVIVSTRGRDTYHKVKQMAERDVGILTQCIKEYTATRRMNPQTIKNILLKVNSKLMGINQVLDARNIPNCLKNGDVMIVGADVTHPSPEQTSIPSIAAVTASMDAKCFSYNIELSIQTPKKEMIVEFEDMMFDHLSIYRQRHRTLPKKIYVFRDGVSEGQFAEVMNSELAAVHKAYQRFIPNAKPEVLFLLVQKRHHTRFFTVPQCNNVEPGTVVDSHIVHPKELDFYLVSHQAIKGTARPTRYHAICNDGNIPHDEVEQLTYYLCHLYSRCMRSVSYPTPTYYAHLACLRARSLTHGQLFDNTALERSPQRLRVLDKMLQFSRMFFV